MRAVVQRVSEARATPGGAIGEGALVLLGIARGDTRADAERLARKIATMRLLGRWERPIVAALVVSQFTLHADTAKGTRPSLSAAAPPEEAEPLYERFCAALREAGLQVETGVFGADMQVALVNDGPVTLIL
ncbi:MAG: D-aminoacyl-tRNA deacylase [Gaiellaceae bacterium]